MSDFISLGLRIEPRAWMQADPFCCFLLQYFFSLEQLTVEQLIDFFSSDINKGILPVSKTVNRLFMWFFFVCFFIFFSVIIIWAFRQKGFWKTYVYQPDPSTSQYLVSLSPLFKILFYFFIHFTPHSLSLPLVTPSYNPLPSTLGIPPPWHFKSL